MVFKLFAVVLLVSGVYSCPRDNITSTHVKQERVTEKPTPAEQNDEAPAGTTAATFVTTRGQSTPDSTDTTDDGLFCPAVIFNGLSWPKTSVENTARVQCPFSAGHVQRHCSLISIKIPFFGEIRKALWAFPDDEECKEQQQPDDLDPLTCPQDTSYATTWQETPVNTTASAKCPANLAKLPDNVKATRRCEWSIVEGEEVPWWQTADLDDCIAASLNTSAQNETDFVQQAVRDWLTNNSCIDDVTTSVRGFFEWNTTIIGGISTAPCAFGTIFPSERALTFIEASLRLTDVFEKFRDNVSSSNITDRIQQLNQTVLTLGERLPDFIANQTAEIVEGILALNLSQKKLVKGVAEWLEISKIVFPGLGDRLTGTGGAPIKMMVPDTNNFKWLNSEASRLNLPEGLIVCPIRDEKHKRVTYDLRGTDPLGTAVEDLTTGLTEPSSNQERSTRVLHNRRRRHVTDPEPATSLPETESLTTAPETTAVQERWSLQDLITGIEFPNISRIVAAFHNLSRIPVRKCQEQPNGQGAHWEDAQTWMCRSENATFGQDLERALDESNNFGLGKTSDLTFVKILLQLWSNIDAWGSTISQVTLAIVHAINYLLSLSEPRLPQFWNNWIIMSIEDLANQPLPDNVSSVRIITENMIIAMEEVEPEDFQGALFASIKPKYKMRGVYESAQGLSTAASIGNNDFEHITGALNDSLQGLDLDNVDEYFYVPDSVFDHDHYDKSENCGAANCSAASSNKSMLQFTIFENDHLFRTDADEVAVSVGEDFSQNQPAEWKVVTRVFSAKLGGHCVRGLKNPVIISLKHHNDFQNGSTRMCVYWDFSGRDGLGTWSSEGCNVSLASSEHTVCECDHLTNYAVIIDIWEQLGKGNLTQPHRMSLEVITYVGCSLSLFGLVVTIGILASVRKLREAKTTPTRVMLCLSLIISMTFYLTGMKQTDNQRACAAFACCIHYTTLVALMWMGVEGAYLYRNVVVVVITPSRHMFRNCFVAAWGVPAVIVGCVAIFDLDAYGNESRCWISDPVVFFAAFLAPALLIVLLNFVVFVMVMWVLFRRPVGTHRYTTGKERRELSRRRKEVFGIVSITALLGLTWIFGSFTVGDGVRITSLYLFVIINSAQGFFIFLFYGLFPFVMTRGVKSSLGTPPFTHSTDKTNQFAVSAAALNKKILQLQHCAVDTNATACSGDKLDLGKINLAFEGHHSLDETKMSISESGETQKPPDLTECSFVVSAGILHAGNQQSLLYLQKPESQCAVLVQPGHRQTEEFVVGTGIIFCGKPIIS